MQQRHLSAPKVHKQHEDEPQILFVIGMHRSATSAFAGCLSLLGASLPLRMPNANAFNPRGYFEPETIVRANDRLLAEMQRHWNDCRPIAQPEGPKRKSAEDHFTRLLRTEFAPGPILALKDPRVSILAPIWLDATERVGAQPSFIVMLRNPVASATSIMRRDGLSEEAAIALWLRYMFDAEYHSREYPRIIIGAEAFVRDPVATLEQVGTALNLRWPTAPHDAQDSIGEFINTGLLDAWENLQSPLADFASEVHASLSNLAATPEAYESLSQIDGLRDAFDEMCPGIHARMVFDQLGKSVTLKWQNDAAQNSLQEVEAIRSENERILNELETTKTAVVNLTDRTHDLADQLAKAAMELEQVNSERDIIQSELNETNTIVAGLIERTQDQGAQLEQRAADAAQANAELARIRRKPLKPFRDLVRYRALSILSKASPPLPARMTQRFARSAAKRNPNRSLTGNAPAAAQGPDLRTTRLTTTDYTIRYAGQALRNSDRPNILVVSHDASRTGAPILTLNLVQSLSQRYNVTTLCLRSGELLNDFCTHSVAVCQATSPTDAGSFYEGVLDDVTLEIPFAFAVVNSIESRYVLPSLKKRGITSVTLLHEFAANTYPKTSFRDAIALADHTVFSTRLTLENAIETNHLTRAPSLHVMPQGKCVVPGITQDPAKGQAERQRLQSLLRSPGLSDRRFIIMGAGYVDYRKGVDLFIDTAMHVLNRREGKDALFVWVGAGFDPVHEIYSINLNDQLKRSGLNGRVLFIPATPEIETLYKLADALVLTSRLDPLPNVAIDAMCEGLPVLCFERTTGIAEMLTEAGLAEQCVAPYLDTYDLAKKLVALASSEIVYSDVCDKTLNFAAATFDFDKYARQIEALALSENPHYDDDVVTITKSGNFAPDFCFDKAARGMTLDAAVLKYVENARTSVGARKPEPGFHPYVFARHMAESLPVQTDPYAEFLRLGRPEGPWLSQVIQGGPAPGNTAPAQISAALHIHAYYTDQLRNIVRRLNCNSTRPDLFISVADKEGEDAARRYLAKYSGLIADVSVVPNAGRDIGPLLTCFGETMIRNYDVVGHIHTKRSMHVGSSSMIASWIEFTFSGVLGGKEAGPVMDRVLRAMQDDESIGVVYPDDPHIVGWTENAVEAERLAQRLALSSLPDVFNFPVGTMFWMRSAAFKPFVDLNLSWSDYPNEPLQSDGTVLHALERLFGVVPHLQGWKTAVTHTPGISR